MNVSWKMEGNIEKIIATIRDGANVLVESVDMWIEITESAEELREWSGYFTLEDGSNHLEPGGPFQLEATDKRAGQVLITNIDFGTNQPTQVYFKGTGPFG